MGYLRGVMKAAIVSVAMACVCAAQSPFVYPVPPTDSFAVRDGLAYQGAVASHSFDLFRPARRASREGWPILVIFNGYGISMMRTSDESRAWAKAATATGLSAITAETTPGHVAEDFDSLTAYLTRHANDLEVDPDRIAVIAWSGNAVTGLETVENPDRKAIKAAVMYYGSGPVTQVRLDVPVLFVRAGLDQPDLNHVMDSVISRGLTANAPWSVLNDPSGHHGFEVADDNDVSRSMVEETFRFLHLVLSATYQKTLRAALPEAAAASAFLARDFARAATLYQPIVDAHPRDGHLLLAYGTALIGAKRYRDARALFDGAKTTGAVGPRDLGLLAARASALDNDPQAAIAWLRSIPTDLALPAALQTDPDFTSLRERPDFQALFHHD